MMTSARTLRICVLVAGAVLGGGLMGCGRPQPMHGFVLDRPDPAPALRLHDEQGKMFDLATERGKPVLVYFGYTHCPDVCPATLADWARAKRALGAKGAGVRFVFVSVDPARDTPQATAAYAWQFDSAFVGLVATTAELEPIQKAWAFQIAREEISGKDSANANAAARSYGVAHPAQTFVIDRTGKLVMIFPPGAKPDDIATDLRRLM